MHPSKVDALALPTELYYEITRFLDVTDILALRKTCKYLLAITQKRGLWLTMFTRLRTTQALPCSRAEFLAMSPSRAEHLLFGACKVEASFLQHREHAAHHIFTMKSPNAPWNAGCSWRVLTFISDSDRFLLSVDNTSVLIWDTTTFPLSSPAVACSPWAHFSLSNFIGYAEHHCTLYIATSCVDADHRSAVIYSVPLPSSETSEDHPGCIHREAEFPLGETEVLKDMEPCLGRLLLQSSRTSIQILHWRDSNRRSVMDVQSDDLDEGWNGITSARFCGPYILCIRLRSVEVYPIPTETPTTNPLPVLQHQFGPVCFRAVSVSRVRRSRCPSGEVYTLFMLTNDIYQGMFHYRVRVTIAPVPSMSVSLLAKGSIQMPDLPSVIPGTNIVLTLGDVISRMYVSTWSLGSAGLRGLWVDRQRGSINRRVVAFTTHPRRLRIKDASSVLGEAPMMDGNVVHVISSYDLGDDITICAVSEWTGRIALGSRVGAILLL